MKVVHDSDINTAALAGKKVAIIGFGSQGHAHALNLRDSGFDVVVGLRRSSQSWKIAEQAGLSVYETPDAVKQADVVMILIPDELQPETYKRDIAPNLRAGAYLAFAHGFCIHFGRITPAENINVFLVAPKGPGHLVRRQYEGGGGVPCLIATHADPAGNTKDIALAYASGIGGGRAGVIETSFREETETDLFGEQAVLCGGLTELIRAGFETLVEAGYAPEMAYFECLHEVKLITDLIYERGIAGMRESISNTAEYGDVTRGRAVIGAPARAAMKTLLKDIQSGAFANEWMNECATGKHHMHELTKRDANHPIEQVGQRLRKMMPWLSQQREAAQKQPAKQPVSSGTATPRPTIPADSGRSTTVQTHAAPKHRTGGASPVSPAARQARAAAPRTDAHGSDWPGFEEPPNWYIQSRMNNDGGR